MIRVIGPLLMEYCRIFLCAGRVSGGCDVSLFGSKAMDRTISIFVALVIGTVCCAYGLKEAAVSGSEKVKNTRSAAANIDTNFETNSTEGWQPRIGTETIAVTSAAKHGGNFSLLTTGRQAAFAGCKINVSNAIAIGSSYRVTVWVKLAPGSTATDLKVSLERNLAGDITYQTAVPNKTVTADKWSKLTAIYDHTLNHESLWMYVESASGTPSFFIDDAKVEFVPPLQIQNSIPSLHQNLESYFKIGAAVWQADISGAHSQLLTKHFNSLTAEDYMKWGPIHPEEGQFNFAPADALVNFATANNIQVRGHALVWHEQNPDWLFRDTNGNQMTPTPANKALLLQRLDTHIRTVVSHYGNRVYAWDVVNEIIDPHEPDGYRRNLWFQICGPEYIDKAFQIARNAAPEAKLFINDYDTGNPEKRAFLLSLVQNLKARGIPIDGVGHQMHSDIDLPLGAEIIETVNMFSAIPGIDNQITEMDLSIYTNETAMYEEVPAEVLMRQGYRYRDLFDAFRQLRGKISSITFWGKADDHSWLSTYPINRLEAPLLFDDRLQAKPAFWGIVDPARLGFDVSGRVTTPDGRGLRNVVVTLTDQSGVKRYANPSSFGYYSFNGVTAFQNYILGASSKRYRFAARSLNVSSDLSSVNLIGLE